MDWVSEFTKTKDGKVQFCIKKIEPYPHLFQPLPWWSGRKLEDMPAFIRFKSDHLGFKAGSVYECSNWSKQIEPFCIGFITGSGKYDKCGMPPGDWLLPATREEYEAFNQQKKL
jgi:hypothetical protein